MKRFVGSCDCGFTVSKPTARGTKGALSRHRCQARYIDLTVEDDGTVEGRLRHYRSLALKIAGQFARKGYRYDDAYADALIGLWQAALHFDPSRGVKFATFATPRIRGAVIDGFRKDSPFSRSQVKAGTAPFVHSIDDLIPQTDIPILDTLVDPNDSISVWWDDQDRAEREAEDEQRLAEVMGTLDQLSARNAAVCRAYVGGRSMFDIGREYGITGSRVCQIWNAWLRKLNPDHSSTHSLYHRDRSRVPA